MHSTPTKGCSAAFEKSPLCVCVCVKWDIANSTHVHRLHLTSQSVSTLIHPHSEGQQWNPKG